MGDVRVWGKLTVACLINFHKMSCSVTVMKWMDLTNKLNIHQVGM